MKSIWHSHFYQTVGVFFALAFVPFVLRTEFGLSVVIFIMIYSIVALSWNLLVGYSGQVSFGHHGFFLVGAYTSALLVKMLGVPFIIGFVASGVAAAVIGVIIGFPAVRLKGFYLAMVTLAVAAILNLLVRYLAHITGGVYGIPGIPKASIGGYVFSSGSSFFYLALIICFLLFLIAQNLLDSRFGYGLQTLRYDELGAMAVGVNISRAKLQIFILSAFYTGLAGSLYAHFVRFVAPDFFNMGFQVVILGMCVVGGVMTVWGAILGAALYTVFPQIITGLEDWYYVIWGIVIILVLAFMPRGIYPSLVYLFRSVKR